VNRQHLDGVSGPEARYDFRSDLHTGFPYTIAHASAVGRALASLIHSPQPKKGLITDLDDTLWAGLVGEVGHESVTWDLASSSQIHGLYQQLLRALADQGVLIAIASKNAPEVVQKALEREDLRLPIQKIFPLEVHWDAKSGSVDRILKAWNISAESVVFVDDSPMELEEVRAAHPDIECVLFPKSDYAAGLTFLRRLRDLFGKARLSEEDAYRLESIRTAQALVADDGAGALAEDFLARAEATVTLEYNPPPSDRRVVELVNKTNQFNLNGIRYSEGEWFKLLEEPGSFALAVSYADKFGPLGKVSVMRGKKTGDVVYIDTWVLSCRAFSRRIEHQCLTQLMEHFGAKQVVLKFTPTPKNEPVRSFLSSIGSTSTPEGMQISSESFRARCPKLCHVIIEKNG
jgi:FkbH-like protein